MAESSLTQRRGWTPEERGVRYRCQNSSDSELSPLIKSIIVSRTLCFGISTAILFCVGDVDAALETQIGFPIIKILFNATKSYAATNAMVSALVIPSVSALGLLVLGSLLIWAFARDDGLQFPRYFSYGDKRFGITVRAVL
ncbi:hypothetical protein M434DRAFT_33243 [Hypoxylon sp. CO27-5]|nr:hypothetical protein M434DRAFT_33243 [Hypoxylon sp. CO27-5]